MTYKFHKETLVSKYIKYLLANTPLPQYPYIYENQYMVEGAVYTYKEKILQCTVSGIFNGLKGGEAVTNYLTASDDLKSNDPFNIDGKGNDNLYMQEYYQYYDKYNSKTVSAWMTIEENGQDILMPLSVTDNMATVIYYPPAEFRILGSYLTKDVTPNVTQVYHSNSKTYDSETHKALGEYLRYLKNIKNVDLMGLYNCFNYTVTKELVIDGRAENVVDEKYNSKYKVVLVPIKFDRTYTIAIDSNSRVFMHPVFYSNERLTKDRRGQYFLYKDILSEVNSSVSTSNLVVHNILQFNRPVTYSIRNFDTNLLKHEKDLYLAIQLPTSNTSSIVVLEGDFVNNKSRVISDASVLTKAGATVEKLTNAMSSNLSLLAVNDDTQHPFADKLIEYLCGNTIDSRELVSDNVARTVSELGNYHYGYEGQWTNFLRYTLYNRYQDYTELKGMVPSEDILGFVDSDIENILQRGHLNRES